MFPVPVLQHCVKPAIFSDPDPKILYLELHQKEDLEGPDLYGAKMMTKGKKCRCLVDLKGWSLSKELVGKLWRF